MLKNYLKLSLKVLLRRPFYTFVSLFGISFTLMVLMVSITMIENSIGARGVQEKFDRTKLFYRTEARGKENTSNSSGAGYYLLNEYVKNLKTPELFSIGSVAQSVSSIVGNKKITNEIRYTDANFWEIANPVFLHGKAYAASDVEKANRVAVIDASFAMDVFSRVDVLGEWIDLEEQQFQVIGVIEDISELQQPVYASIFVPITTTQDDLNRKELVGSYVGYALLKDDSDTEKLEAEWAKLKKTIVFPNPEFDTLICLPRDLKDIFAGEFMFSQADESNTAEFFMVLIGLMILFAALPTLNLININISRIMERSSEIGVRKAFGASSSVLIKQFLVENLVLTLLGGILGYVLSLFAMELIANGDLIGGVRLQMNLSVFLICFFMIIVFGVFSGVYPAWKMSRTPVVNALNNGKL